jgi:PAS domain S-box-containing protein
MINKTKKTLTHYTLALFLIWTFLIILLTYNELYEIKTNTIELATKEARTHFNRDQAFRLWGASHGGVYVPIDEKTPPNKYLTHIAERDIKSPSGKKLTLMNPAYMVRQMGGLFSELYGVIGHITSLKPLRPENAPDEWEKKALMSFEEGKLEVSEIINLDNKSYLRLMRPVFAEKPCLKCHAHQGYKEGDVRGGISVSIPMEPYLKKEREDSIIHLLSLSFIWFLGICGIGVGMKSLKQRWQAEEEKRTSEHRYHELVETLSDIIYTISKEGTFLSLNKAFEDITGITCSEAIGRHFSLFTHPDDLDMSTKIFNVAISGAPPPSFEIRVLTKQGTYKPIEMRGTPLVKNNEVIGVSGIGRDITERKAIESEKQALWNQLLQAQKMESVGRLASGISHDFNNILTGILGYAELISRELDEKHPAKKKVATIINSCKSAAKLTRQLLAFSRKQVLDMRLNNLNIILDKMSNMLERMVGTDIKVQINSKNKIKNTKVDSTQIEQILLNLVINAKNAMPHGGDLTIEIKNVTFSNEDTRIHKGTKAGDYVMLSVADTGVGIEKDIQENIFEPFFTTREKEKGSGLGLSTVFGIVKQHNGFIIVDSEPGKGAVFKLYFPAEAAGTIEEEKAEEPTCMRGGDETILLVDNDIVIRNFTIETLESIGYKLFVAGSAEEAIIISENYEDHIDLLLTDVIMTGEDGWALSEKISTKRPAIKVIFVSGSLDDSIILNNIMKHGAPFINKPFTTKKLICTIRDVLDKKT